MIRYFQHNKRQNRALHAEYGVLTWVSLTADPIAPGGRAIDY